MSEIRKILIHLPEDPVEVMELFPFVTTVHDLFPSSQMNLISTEVHEKMLGLLNFRTYFYHIPKDIYQSAPLIHKYCVNLNEVFNIDLSFALEDSWHSAFLAFCFRSRHRLGQTKLSNRLFLNHSFKENITSRPLLAKRLLETFVKDPVSLAKPSLIESVVDDEHFGEIPIVIVAITAQRYENLVFQDQFKELLKHVSHIKFHFIVLSDSEDNPQALTGMAEENFYKYTKADPENWIAFSKKIAYASALVTESKVLARLAEFHEVPTVLLGDNSLKTTLIEPVIFDHRGRFDFKKIASLLQS